MLTNTQSAGMDETINLGLKCNCEDVGCREIWSKGWSTGTNGGLWLVWEKDLLGEGGPGTDQKDQNQNHRARGWYWEEGEKTQMIAIQRFDSCTLMGFNILLLGCAAIFGFSTSYISEYFEKERKRKRKKEHRSFQSEINFIFIQK